MVVMEKEHDDVLQIHIYDTKTRIDLYSKITLETYVSNT